MKNLTMQQLIMAEVGGALAFIALAFMFLFQPMLRALDDIDQQKQGLSMKLETGQTGQDPASQERFAMIQKQLEFRRTQLAAVQKRRSEVEAAFLQEQDLAQLINRFVKMSDPNRVELASVKPSEREEVGTQYHEVKLEMQLKGTYADLVDFLSQLQTVGRPLYVKELSLEVDEMQFPRLQARASIATLFPRSPEEPPQGALTQ